MYISALHSYNSINQFISRKASQSTNVKERRHENIDQNLKMYVKT